MQNYIQTADTIGVPDKAVALARVYPDAINKEGWLRLYSDGAALCCSFAWECQSQIKAFAKKNIHEAIRRCDRVIKLLYEQFPERVAAMQQAYG
ncbi:MAG: hypothetical protein R3E61_08650 [Pseudomonadales bacterium]